MTTILATIESDAASAVSAVRHGAAWLFGAATEAKADLSTMEASNPLVAMAVTAGIGAAKEHGVPVDQIEATVEDVLNLAKTIGAPPAAVQESEPQSEPQSIEQPGTTAA